MKIDKYWLFKIHSMADGDDDGGGGGGGGDGSMLPAGKSGGEGDGGDGAGDGSGDGDGAGDGSGGDGDQEWFKKDKYKTVEDQAKAYSDLEKKLGESSTLTGAPEGDYELTMPEGVDGEFIEGNPSINKVLAYAKEKNLSQEHVTGLLHAFIAGEAELNQTSTDTEMKTLGDNADRRLQNLADFGTANLSTEEYEAFRGVASTAAGVQVLEAMMGLTKGHKLPNPGDFTPGQTGVTPESLKEMAAKKDENGHRLMSIDPTYKAKVDKAYNDFYGSAPKQTVVG